MADAIALARVEEQDLVRLGDRVVAAEMAHVDAAIREDHVQRGRELLRALVPAQALAPDVADDDAGRLQQELGGDLRHACDCAIPAAGELSGACGRCRLPPCCRSSSPPSCKPRPPPPPPPGRRHLPPIRLPPPCWPHPRIGGPARWCSATTRKGRWSRCAPAPTTSCASRTTRRTRRSASPAITRTSSPTWRAAAS